MYKKFFSITMLLAFLISVSALPVPAADNIETDGKYTVVTVESQGENRLAAIESGLVESLRLASGSFIDSKSELNNDELTERIISYSRGSIAKYEVLMADDTKADDGIFNVKLKVWVESDLLRDGVKVATNKTSKVAFKKSDLKPEKDELKAAALENKDSMTETNKSNASSGVEALSAMLERYNPEDFISIKVVGKVTPVKGKEAEDLCQVLVEVSFNDSLYNDAFIPDLKQVLDSISAKKKDITLTKQRDILRGIVNKKGAPMADTSVVMYGAELKDNEFQLAVYDKPDRFGCRLYSFKKEDADKILNNQTGVLAQFRSKIAKLKGFEIELLDEKGEIVSTEEQKITLSYLLTDSVVRNNVWAFHPSIMNYSGMYNYVPLYIENKAITLPLRFELPKEFQDITAEINTKLVFEDEFAEAAVKTRNALHNAAINGLAQTASNQTASNIFQTASNIIAQKANNNLPQKANKADFDTGVEVEYPLAEAAVNTIKADEIRLTKGLLLDEVIDRLGEFRDKGSHATFRATAYRLELETKNYENQKKCVPYLTQAAMADPEAMIRMGEIYEQGFYDVKPNPKRADSYYKEGTRILSLLASQGLPSAAAALGHVYIEGLGTKQDIPRAERYYKFAEKAGYEDPEFWVWKHFGVTLRQVTIPEKLKQKRDFNKDNAKTCLYLVREKVYAYELEFQRYNSLNLLNIRSDIVAAALKARGRRASSDFYVYTNGDSMRYSYK